MPGLHDVTLVLTLSFQVQPQEFVQVLHDGHAHRLTVSNIGLRGVTRHEATEAVASVKKKGVALQKFCCM